MSLPSNYHKVFLLVPRRIWVCGKGMFPELRWRWMRFAYRGDYFGFTVWQDLPPGPVPMRRK